MTGFISMYVTIV